MRIKVSAVLHSVKDIAEYIAFCYKLRNLSGLKKQKLNVRVELNAVMRLAVVRMVVWKCVKTDYPTPNN